MNRLTRSERSIGLRQAQQSNPEHFAAKFELEQNYRKKVRNGKLVLLAIVVVVVWWPDIFRSISRIMHMVARN
ncbi:MAG: hypothetical protein WDN47_02125 [Candidatus Doudnabacteria bacterium]